MSKELYEDREFLAWELSQQIGEKAMRLAEVEVPVNIELGEN